MKGNTFLLLWLWLATATQGQVALKLSLQPDGKTYTVFARSQATWSPPLENLTHSARVTVVVPAGSFQLINLQSHAGIWQLTNLVGQPAENSGADYAVFQLASATSGIAYQAGQDVALFSFQNDRSCNGAFEIMAATDPFSSPNSLGIPVENEWLIQGAGPGNAWDGSIFDAGAADCMNLSDCQVALQIELAADGYYAVSLLPDAAIQPPYNVVKTIRTSLKAPTGHFTIHNLTNLLPGVLSFGATHRYNSPPEAPGFDYFSFQLDGSLSLQPGVKIPLFKFGNGGSCQGDSIFLVNHENDPFLPPNSLGATVGQLVLPTDGSAGPLGVCFTDNGSAPCAGCLFTDGMLTLDSIMAAGQVSCLGNNNGVLHLYAHGANNLEFSIDGGQTWSAGNHFNGLAAGAYHPVVRGERLGCAIVESGDSVLLQANPVFELVLGLPSKVCAGSDFGLSIMAPSPLPFGTSYYWTGPNGFTAGFADPVIFDANAFQSGTYTLVVSPPGCNPNHASGMVQVVEPVETPTVLINSPLCDKDTLSLRTATVAEKYEWIGPLGEAPSVLSLPGITTKDGATFFPKNHPAYLPGEWRVRVTDINRCVVMSQAVALEIRPRPYAWASNDGPVCAGGAAVLRSNPLPDAIYRWHKMGQPGVFSMLPNPVVANVTDLTTFALAVEVQGCASDNLSLTTIGPHPAISANPVATYQPAANCSPAPLQMTANATGAGLTYLWTGPNGFISQVENPVIPNAGSGNNGSYELVATDIFGCTVSEAFQVLNITDALPTPQVQGTPPVCPGGTMTLSITGFSSLSATYQWYKNGNPILGATAADLYLTNVSNNTQGAYRAQVKVGDCTLQSADYQVTVLSAPVAGADFTLSHPCEGGTLQFFSNTAGVVDWRWSGPNGFTSDAAYPLIYNTEFNDIGAYSLTVTSANGCTAVETVVVDGILPNPDVPVVATNSPVCPEDSIVLQVQNVSSAANVLFEWVNGAGQTIGNGEAKLALANDSPDAVQPFLVKTIVNTCTSELSPPVEVEVRPAPVALASINSTVCPGESVQLYAAPVTAGQYVWREMVSGQVVSFQQNPLLTITDTTLYELSVKTAGCDTEAKTQILAPVKPVPIITGITGGGSFCEGDSALLDAQNTAALNGDQTFQWIGPHGFVFSGVASDTAHFPLSLPNLTEEQGGVYTLLVQSAGGCNADPQSVLVSVAAMPAPPSLTASDNTFCQGESLLLDAGGSAGSISQYDWYFSAGPSAVLLASTSVPTWFVPSLMPSNSGLYHVVALSGGCASVPSNALNITVIDASASISAGNSTNVFSPACEGETVHLSVPFISGATYDWYGPAGFFSTLPSPVVPAISIDQAGNYMVVVSLPACAAAVLSSTMVFVDATPPKPLLTGETAVCEGSAFELKVLNGVAGFEFEFYKGQNLLATGALPSFSIPATKVTDSGNYFAVALANACKSAPSDVFPLLVDDLPANFAFAGKDRTLCPGEAEFSLDATSPSVGVGSWSALDGGAIVNPNQAGSMVQSLPEGVSRFVWALSNGVCQAYSTDTVYVSRQMPLTASEDSFVLKEGDKLLDVNLLENDNLGASGNWLFEILEKPRKGALYTEPDGVVSYHPFPSVQGFDAFHYLLCLAGCPAACDTATVSLQLGGSTDSAECFIPNLITPNGDGENDNFLIPCVLEYPNPALTVYNRWGAKVFDTKNYQNDWAGDYEGQPLPVGTYFYSLTLNDPKKTALHGYVVIMR
jgi:gliding motility-associated-like protein